MIGIDRRKFALGAGALAACAAAPDPPQATLWRALPAEPYRGKQDNIVFVSRDVGWYGNGAGKLYRTTNGGEAWEKIWEQPGTFIRALVDAANAGDAFDTVRSDRRPRHAAVVGAIERVRVGDVGKVIHADIAVISSDCECRHWT
jgi:hypothetical protein